jgi:hypothetical protein
MPTYNSADYSPEMLYLQIGSVPVTGFASGDFLTIEPSGPAFKGKVGSHGGLSVAEMVAGLHTVKVTLLRGSASHPQLTSQGEVAKNAHMARLDFVFKDLLSGETFTGVCWGATPSGYKAGDEGGDHDHNYEARLTHKAA